MVCASCFVGQGNVLQMTGKGQEGEGEGEGDSSVVGNVTIFQLFCCRKRDSKQPLADCSIDGGCSATSSESFSWFQSTQSCPSFRSFLRMPPSTLTRSETGEAPKLLPTQEVTHD